MDVSPQKRGFDRPQHSLQKILGNLENTAFFDLTRPSKWVE